jgi:IS4 transposase
MENSRLCVTCYKPKTPLQCGICEGPLCKACTQFVDEETFSFLRTIPAELSHTEIAIYYKTEAKETRLVKRLEEPYVIENCPDKNETLLRMAFFAVKDRFNALVDVELKSEKVRRGSYQTLKWSGSAVPFMADPRKTIIKTTTPNRSSSRNPVL